MNNVTFGDGNSGYYETVAGGAGAVSNNELCILNPNLQLYYKLFQNDSLDSYNHYFTILRDLDTISLSDFFYF